jgi:dienelactone hydrolase
MVAGYLQEHGFGTLLFDLLTEEEDQRYHTRFDIDLLTKRLVGATEWLEGLAVANHCRIGYFGASTGAAAALKAAAVLPQIEAVVSRGGRPDLAMDSLPQVEAPVLLIVGGLDHDVLKLNQQAYIFIESEKKWKVIPGATHLFEEHGAMEQVCESAASWFEKYLQPVANLK